MQLINIIDGRLRTLFIWIVVFVGIYILAYFLILLFRIIIDMHYKKKLNKITPDINSFPLDSKMQEYSKILNDFQSLQHASVSDNEDLNERLCVTTFVDIVQQND
jgi:hypothetical protein